MINYIHLQVYLEEPNPSSNQSRFKSTEESLIVLGEERKSWVIKQNCVNIVRYSFKIVLALEESQTEIVGFQGQKSDGVEGGGLRNKGNDY